MRESTVYIGKPKPLVGVLTEGAAGEDTALILLNSGIMHRVGACRVSVRLARRVAEQVGLPCLRFDLSGVGDSEARSGGGVDFDQAALAEITEAMDFMQHKRGIRHFVLYGLCSGALLACRAAEQDARVIGVAQIDGCCYPTRRSELMNWRERLFSTERWQRRCSRFFGGRTQARGSVLLEPNPNFEIPEFARDPGRQASAEQLGRLMARRVHLHCIFTGREPAFNYPEQYRDCFHEVDFGDRLSVDYYPRASHIFAEPEYREMMINGVVQWTKSICQSECIEQGMRASA